MLPAALRWPALRRSRRTSWQPAGGTPADEDRARHDRPARHGGDRRRRRRHYRLAGLPAARGAKSGSSASAGAAGWLTGSRSRPADAFRRASLYGPAPAPAEAGGAGADADPSGRPRRRVNATAIPGPRPSDAAGKDVTLIVHPGVDHAFHNDTSVARYDKAAATRAWTQTTQNSIQRQPLRQLRQKKARSHGKGLLLCFD